MDDFSELWLYAMDIETGGLGNTETLGAVVD